MAENKNLFNEEDLEISIDFLEAKGCLVKDSRKKLDIESYLDNGNNSVVVVSNKKRPAFLKSVMSQKVLAVYEIRANEDYAVLIQLPGAHEPAVANRDIYYPDFKANYLAKKNESSEPQM